MTNNIELMALVADLLSSKDLSRKSIGSEIKRLTSKQDEQLAALREAGEKMAEMLKFLQLQNDAARLESAGLWSVNGETEMQVAEAREAWEAANK